MNKRFKRLRVGDVRHAVVRKKRANEVWRLGRERACLFTVAKNVTDEQITSLILYGHGEL